ncbi:MAG: SPOR domain-containing protein [Pseudooceanicola sp.]
MFSGNSQGLGAVRASSRYGLRAGVALSLVLGLSACMDGGEFPMFQSKPAEGAEDVSTRRATRLIERDVEAPDVFQVTEAGLWDGRPSLGGVWVAHPDVTEPERVLIRNTTNDKFVIGALFRRERENPGPRLQVSSDAAAALGLLAGTPQNLNVTALRREEVPTEPETVAEVLPEPGAVSEETLDPIASAERAIAEAEVKPAAPAATEAVAETGSDAAAATAAATSELADAAVAAPAEAAPKKKGFFASLFGKKPRQAETAADDVQTVELSTPQVTTQPLDAMQTPPAELTTGPVQKASVPAPAPSPRPGASLDKPYLQIGIFSIEENASNTATAMKQAGMIPTVRKQSSKGQVFWRVLIGPATSEGERSALLKKVKATGFTDAYAVTN